MLHSYSYESEEDQVAKDLLKHTNYTNREVKLRAPNFWTIYKSNPSFLRPIKTPEV
jgi:hypothetical protein